MKKLRKNRRSLWRYTALALLLCASSALLGACMEGAADVMDTVAEQDASEQDVGVQESNNLSTPSATPIPTEKASPTPLESEFEAVISASPEPDPLPEQSLSDFFDEVPGLTMNPVSNDDLSLTFLADNDYLAEADISERKFFGIHVGEMERLMKRNDTKILMRDANGQYIEYYGVELDDRFEIGSYKPSFMRFYFDEKLQLKRTISQIKLNDSAIPATNDELMQADSEFSEYFKAAPNVSYNLWGDGNKAIDLSTPRGNLISGGSLMRFWYLENSNEILSIHALKNGEIVATLVSESTDGSLETPLPDDIQVILVRDLSNYYARNEIAGEANYKGKTVLLSGVVQSVRRNEEGRAIVTFAPDGGRQVDPDATYILLCKFNAAHESEMISLEAGKRAVILGMIDGLSGEKQGEHAVIELSRCSVPSQEEIRSSEEAQENIADNTEEADDVNEANDQDVLESETPENSDYASPSPEPSSDSRR